MTLESLFAAIVEYRVPIILLLAATPWLTHLLCYFIPGQKEEPLLLSVNLGLATLSIIMLSGYLAYATNTGGWQLVVKQADLFLLLLPPYHLITSLWLSQRRLPLHLIPAYRTLQGLVMLAGVFLFLSWLASRIHIIFFSYIPFTTFLFLLAIVLSIGYVGYRKVLGKD